MLYSGDDSMMPYFALSNCKGLVSVAANVWPNEVFSYVKNCLNANAQKVSEMMPLWNSAIKSLFTAANPTCPKVLMHKLGLIETSTLRAPLTNNEPVNIEELMHNHKQVSQWGQNHA
ncbi:MAG: dihydrodipicolinate synthase family protein [Bacteriovoracaceae bacterium]